VPEHPSTECARLAVLFDATLDGDPYYGPSLLATLRAAGDGLLTLRPSWARHSASELTAHVAAEMRYTIQIIDGTAPPWVEGETTWPPPAASLAATLDDLTHSSRSLTAAVRALDDSALDRETTLKLPLRTVLYGTLQHNAYHAGQIVLLLKASDASVAREPKEAVRGASWLFEIGCPSCGVILDGRVEVALSSRHGARSVSSVA
jgi:uncharacterized damage-inducible protein DinB